ncbi:MAG: tRNA ((37)-N6)-threonylcarbamoyltransferase complex ATPase subunit type 1 TsaE [Verrucomicrobiota bacterium]|jgi:tRNA threonylcarbamoyladenosine biosynthesis protein TsaE
MGIAGFMTGPATGSVDSGGLLPAAGGIVVLADAMATVAAGEALGKELRGGQVIALSGGLGAGKTHFSKGIARGLGFACGEVTSPTFSLVQEYRGGRLPVFHFDFYRMESADEVLALGWDEYVEAGGVCVVEWAERFPELMPEGVQWWRLEPDSGGGRRLTRLREGVS